MLSPVSLETILNKFTLAMTFNWWMLNAFDSRKEDEKEKEEKTGDWKT